MPRSTRIQQRSETLRRKEVRKLKYVTAKVGK